MNRRVLRACLSSDDEAISWFTSLASRLWETVLTRARLVKRNRHRELVSRVARSVHRGHRGMQTGVSPNLVEKDGQKWTTDVISRHVTVRETCHGFTGYRDSVASYRRSVVTCQSGVIELVKFNTGLHARSHTDRRSRTAAFNPLWAH